MPVDHYENFPVASVLMPAPLREPVEAIYAFARSADDIADEGNDPPQTRHDKLKRYYEALEDIAQHKISPDPIFTRLAHAVKQHELPLGLLKDLLDAFTQDIDKNRYANFPELLDYCRRSANPVGRLLLHLYHAATPENCSLSDKICTSLQLINFWQDVAIDWQKNRIYLPKEDLERFGIEETHIAQEKCDAPWQALMSFQVTRARTMMQEGAPLARVLPGRVGWELRLVVQGGLRILEKIESAHYNIFQNRPTLEKRDWLCIGWRALTNSPKP